MLLELFTFFLLHGLGDYGGAISNTEGEKKKSVLHIFSRSPGGTIFRAVNEGVSSLERVGVSRPDNSLIIFIFVIIIF